VSSPELGSPHPRPAAPPLPPLLHTRVLEALRTTPVSMALLIACLLAWGLTRYWGDGSDALLWYMGSNDGRAVQSGQLYRLLSCWFLHLGGIHLLLNMISLRALSGLEGVLGSAAFLLLYVGSGLGASLATALLRPETISVGASGAIWGLMGAAFGMRIPARHVLRAQGVPLTAGSSALVLNLGISFLPGVDLAAHLGGGAVGFVLGATLFYPDYARRETYAARVRRHRVLRAGAVLASMLVLAALAQALREGRPWQFREPPEWQRVALGSSGFSLELPGPLAREAQTELAERTDFRFGREQRSPVLVEVSVLELSPRNLAGPDDAEQPEPAASPSYLDPSEVEQVLSDFSDEVRKQQAPESLPRRSLELAWLGQRRVLRDEYAGEHASLTRYVFIVGATPLLVEVWRSQEWHELWPGVAERVASSLQRDRRAR
jgi:membrane associated rhomboid family serine protease